MAFTSKQQRNGADVGGADQNTAQPGPSPDVGGLMSGSQAAAEVKMAEAHAFWTSPAGSGVAGHQIGGYGAMFEWDAGLAIHDVEGGGSG